MKYTQKQMLEGALKMRGYVQIQTQTRKYTVWRNDEPSRMMFVGKMGALRVGRTSTGSVPCAESFKRALIEEFRAQVVGTPSEDKPRMRTYAESADDLC